jgi:hypothetical protein
MLANTFFISRQTIRKGKYRSMDIKNRKKERISLTDEQGRV